MTTHAGGFIRNFRYNYINETGGCARRWKA